MLNASSYALQYSNVDVAAVIAANIDVFVTEGAPFSPVNSGAITDAQLVQLQASGTKVFGYVDAAVTDDLRPYWNPAWTSDGTDQGTVLPTAPAWLQTGLSNIWGKIVDYRDPAWRQIVIGQAVELVTRGYDGVFLDETTVYYAFGQGIGNFAAASDAMMSLVVEIDQAIRAVNPNAEVIVNGTPYIVTDATGGWGGAGSQAFLAALDGMLLESFFGINLPNLDPAIGWARTYIQPFAKLLAIEFGGTPFQNHLFQSEAQAMGILTAISPANLYNALTAPSAPATNASEILLGTARSNVINALGGNDQVMALGGNDIIDGGAGSDVIDGGTGQDRMTGGLGNDIYFVQDSRDYVIESANEGFDEVRTALSSYVAPANIERVRFAGAGNCILSGNALANQLYGGDGNDIFVDVNTGPDTFFGGSGTDLMDYRRSAIGAFYHFFSDGSVSSSGAAMSDSFSSIERFAGSNVAADSFVGDGMRVYNFSGYGGNDSLEGGDNRDTLSGGAGADTIAGKGGHDMLYGGTEADQFVYLAQNFGNDRILDFEGGIDKLRFFAAVANELSDFSITHNGATVVTLTLIADPTSSITLRSLVGPVTLDATDFIFS